MLSKIMLFIASLLMIFRADTLLASQLVVHLGPPAAGNGGPNPLTIPPLNPLDYEVVYITDADREWSISISPGIFYGFRSGGDEGTYASAGGGLVINANGVGPGVYTAFGYNAFCGTACFNIEYKQALGISDGHIISPYAIRMGLSFSF